MENLGSLKARLQQLIQSNLAHLGPDKDLEKPVKIGLKAVSQDIWSNIDKIPLVSVTMISSSL